jgi:hypothetical protein
MNRREFLKSLAALAAAANIPFTWNETAESPVDEMVATPNAPSINEEYELLYMQLDYKPLTREHWVFGNPASKMSTYGYELILTQRYRQRGVHFTKESKCLTTPTFELLERVKNGDYSDFVEVSTEARYMP